MQSRLHNSNTGNLLLPLSRAVFKLCAMPSRVGVQLQPWCVSLCRQRWLSLVDARYHLIAWHPPSKICRPRGILAYVLLVVIVYDQGQVPCLLRLPAGGAGQGAAAARQAGQEARQGPGACSTAPRAAGKYLGMPSRPHVHRLATALLDSCSCNRSNLNLHTGNLLRL